MNYKIFTTLLFSVLIFSINTEAQQDFSNLSAKQKIKLGKKEQKEAKKDPEYLQLMSEGMVYFQNKDYEKAIVTYENAHNRRPNNVYPMVMLEDINVAKKLISAETTPETEVVLTNNDAAARDPENKKSEIMVDLPADSVLVLQPQNPNINEVQTEDPIVINTPEKIEKQVVIPTEVKPIEKKEEKVYENDFIYRETLKEGRETIYQTTIVNH